MENILIKRTTDIQDSPSIHNVLLEAFNPYKSLYTTEAFNATVVSIERLEKRIADPESVVFISICDDEIAGTVSLRKMNESEMYIASMGVKPDHHGKGIGSHLLSELEKTAKNNKCSKLILETSAPLVDAIRLYEKLGFRRTGKNTDYYGVNIFEMVKEI